MQTAAELQTATDLLTNESALSYVQGFIAYATALGFIAGAVTIVYKGGKWIYIRVTDEKVQERKNAKELLKLIKSLKSSFERCDITLQDTHSQGDTVRCFEDIHGKIQKLNDWENENSRFTDGIQNVVRRWNNGPIGKKAEISEADETSKKGEASEVGGKGKKEEKKGGFLTAWKSFCYEGMESKDIYITNQKTGRRENNWDALDIDNRDVRVLYSETKTYFITLMEQVQRAVQT